MTTTQTNNGNNATHKTQTTQTWDNPVMSAISSPYFQQFLNSIHWNEIVSSPSSASMKATTTNAITLCYLAQSFAAGMVAAQGKTLSKGQQHVASPRAKATRAKRKSGKSRQKKVATQSPFATLAA